MSQYGQPIWAKAARVITSIFAADEALNRVHRLQRIEKDIKTWREASENHLIWMQQRENERIDAYVEQEAQRWFKEYVNAPVIKIGGRVIGKMVGILIMSGMYIKYQYHEATAKYGASMSVRDAVRSRYDQLVQQHKEELYKQFMEEHN